MPRQKRRKTRAAASPVVDGVQPQFAPREPLKPSSRITYAGELSQWARAAYSSGQHYVYQQKWDEAGKAFYRALETQKDFLDAHLWLGLLVTDPAQKRKHLEFVLSTDPNHLQALRELMILDGKLDPNADVLNPFTEAEKQDAGGAVGTDTALLRCERCGSNMVSTDEATGLAVCGSCGYAKKYQRAGASGGVLTMALLQRRSEPVQWVVGERLVACGGCGAERTLTSEALATRCMFCDSVHIIERDVLGSFQQPEGLVPFAITAKQAEDAIHTQLSSMFERVAGWFGSRRVERMTIEGAFLPAWVFDCMAGVRRTVIRDTSDNRRSGSDIGAYSTTNIADGMVDVIVFSVKSPSPHLLNRLGKYDFKGLVDYEPSLIAQYAAQIYSIDFDQASLTARGMVAQALREKHHRSVHNAQVNVAVEVKQMTFRLLLLPVWVAMLYEDDGDLRTALVNGQSGQVALGKARKPESL